MDSDESKSVDDDLNEKDVHDKWMLLAQEEFSSILELIKVTKSKLSNISRDDIKSGVKYPHDSKTSFQKWLLKTYSDRTSRMIYFPIEGIFGEPCWDMLLDLAIHKVAGKPVSVTSVCIASKVPITTALRWISILEEHGFIAKKPDSHDKRRTYIELSEKGLISMRKYFESLEN